jgi:hypothetical protein
MSHNSCQILSDSIYFAVIYELSKKRKSLSGSHPDESYEAFSDKEFDNDGKTTWHEDREWTKQYLKDMGLL